MCNIKDILMVMVLGLILRKYGNSFAKMYLRSIGYQGMESRSRDFGARDLRYNKFPMDSVVSFVNTWIALLRSKIIAAPRPAEM